MLQLQQSIVVDGRELGLNQLVITWSLPLTIAHKEKMSAVKPLNLPLPILLITNKLLLSIKPNGLSKINAHIPSRPLVVHQLGISKTLLRLLMMDHSPILMFIFTTTSMETLPPKELLLVLRIPQLSTMIILNLNLVLSGT